MVKLYEDVALVFWMVTVPSRFGPHPQKPLASTGTWQPFEQARQNAAWSQRYRLRLLDTSLPVEGVARITDSGRLA